MGFASIWWNTMPYFGSTPAGTVQMWRPEEEAKEVKLWAWVCKFRKLRQPWPRHNLTFPAANYPSKKLQQLMAMVKSVTHWSRASLGSVISHEGKRFTAFFLYIFSLTLISRHPMKSSRPMFTARDCFADYNWYPCIIAYTICSKYFTRRECCEDLRHSWCSKDNAVEPIAVRLRPHYLVLQYWTQISSTCLSLGQDVRK